MTKKALTYIVVLMSISLLGIGGLQWYWVRETATTKNLEFDQKVRSALAATTDELDERETERFIHHGLKTTNIPYLTVVKRKEKEIAELKAAADSMVKDISTAVGFQAKADSIHTWIDEDVQMLAFDTLLSHLDSGSHQGVMTIRRTISNDTETIDTVITRDQLRYKSMVFGSAFKSLFVKELSQKEDLESRIEGVAIDSLLNVHLADAGIDIAFNYGIKDNQGAFVKSNLAVNSFPGDAFVRRIFRSGDNASQLVIHFPSRGAYLLKSMGWVLLVVLLLSLVMIATFAITLRYILRQKRVSAIKSDFINNMTHEFKTPLATIGLAVDSMRHPATKGDEERQEYYAQLISDEKKRLTGHIEKILQLAKMDRGDIIIKPERFSCEQLLNEAVTNMQLQADARDGSVRLVVEDAIGDITADRSHLYNAVINLLDNAIKYSEKPPQVVLMAKKQKDGLKIIVEDNGIGMSSEDQKRVLETFYRAQTGDVHDVKGFGLGLSYVKEIVNLHRGEMIVKSILGSGSQIGFQIPTSL